MRKVDWRLVPEAGELALLTMDELVDGGPLMLADFRDVKALVHKETGAYVGLSRSRGIRLGTAPIAMKDGIWYVTEDAALGERRKDVPVTAQTAILQLIER
jgi:hypothetical protein